MEVAQEVMGVGAEQLRECSHLLNSIISQDEVIDKWRWNLHS